MTDACYLARGAHPLRKPTTCEECYVHDACKMFANFKELRNPEAEKLQAMNREKEAKP